MKTWAIVRIIISAVVIILLTALLVMGISGKLFPGILTTGRATIRSELENATVAGETNRVPAAAIREIRVDWVAGSLTFASGAGEEIVFSESASQTLQDAQRMRYAVSGDTLTITFCESTANVWSWLDADKLNMPAKALSIAVPEDCLAGLRKLSLNGVSCDVTASGTVGDAVRLETVSGTIEAEAIRCRSLRTESVSGEITVREDCTAKELNADTVSGTVRILGAFEEIDAETVSGRITIEAAAAPDDIDVDTTSGDITLVLPEDAGFTASLDSVSGDLTCEIPGVMNRKTVVCGDGSAKYEFDSVSGDVSIRKK